MKQRLFKKTVIALALSAALNQGVFANEWQPMSSERLVKLPAPVMVRALEKDFQRSSLAESIVGSSKTLGGIRSELETLTKALSESEVGSNEMEGVNISFQMLKKKSAYLDEMKAHQGLETQALKTKVRIYEKLLKSLQTDRKRAGDPVSQEVRAAQLAARERMKAQRKNVGDNLFPSLAGKQSRYSKEYEANNVEIRRIQQHIKNHAANNSAQLDGVDVSRETFVRHLLAQAEADIALLGQEDELLGYMARLVALDAQSLQIKVAFGEDEDVIAKTDERKPRNMVDLFIN